MINNRRGLLQAAILGAASLLWPRNLMAESSTVTLDQDGEEYVAGSFGAKNDTWGRESLINGRDYTNSISIERELFPSGTLMRWNWPQGDNVRAYNAINYRPPMSDIRLDYIEHGLVSFEVDIQAEDGSYYALSEGFIYDGADLAWPPAAEIGVFYHPMPRFTPTIQDTIHIDGYDCSIVVEWTSEREKWPFIKICLPQKIDTLTINLVSLYAQLKVLGLVTGREYFSSWKVGVEVLGGSGELFFRRTEVEFSAQRKLSIGGTPVRTVFDNEAYSGFLVEAYEGRPPYTYSLTGEWPPGIVIDPISGAVSGSSSARGIYSGLSVAVVDSAGATARLPPFAVSVEVDTRPVSLPAGRNYVVKQIEDFSFENISVLGNIGGSDKYSEAVILTENGGTAQHKIIVNGKKMSGLEDYSRLRAQLVVKGIGRNIRMHIASERYDKQVLVSFDLNRGEEIHRHAQAGWIVLASHVIPLEGGFFLVAVDFSKGDEPVVRWLINVLDGRNDVYASEENSGIAVQNFYLSPLPQV